MLLFCFYFCFAAVVFSAAENLFSDDNEQSLSASLFTSEDLGPLNSIDLSSQPGNLNPTDLFQLSFDADPTEIDYSLVPTGSQDIFDLTLSENLPEFADDALFSENIIAANDCGLDNSRVQGRVRARGSTCSNTTPENGVSGSSPQKNKPPEENQKEPEPLAGGGVDDWDKTCKYNGLEDIMVCSSGNPGDDIVQRIPISGLYSLQYSSSIVTFLDWWECLYPKKVWCCRRFFPLDHFRAQRLDPPRPLAIYCSPPLGQTYYR